MSMEIRRDVMIVVMFVRFDARNEIISEKICAVTAFLSMAKMLFQNEPIGIHDRHR
jgi:hypothetical protein